MTFGLRNAPVCFQRAVRIILSSVRFKSVMVYLEGHHIPEECRRALRKTSKPSYSFYKCMTIQLIKMVLPARFNRVPRSNRQTPSTIRRSENELRRSKDDANGNQDATTILPRNLRLIPMIRQRLRIRCRTTQQLTQ